MKAILVVWMLLVIGCSKSVDKKTCEDLAFKTYKGWPIASAEYEKYCLEYSDLKYTPEICQKALVELVDKVDIIILEEKYGDRVIECFTKNDLNNFSRK